jgi:hypothetical protein
MDDNKKAPHTKKGNIFLKKNLKNEKICSQIRRKKAPKYKIM